MKNKLIAFGMVMACALNLVSCTVSDSGELLTSVEDTGDIEKNLHDVVRITADEFVQIGKDEYDEDTTYEITGTLLSDAQAYNCKFATTVSNEDGEYYEIQVSFDYDHGLWGGIPEDLELLEGDMVTVQAVWYLSGRDCIYLTDGIYISHEPAETTTTTTETTTETSTSETNESTEQGSATNSTASSTTTAKNTSSTGTSKTTTAKITTTTTVATTVTTTQGASLRIVSVTSPASRNEMATLTIVGKPNTEYDINVYYSSGASTADGLENKVSDANGNVSWTWKVGGSTNPGEKRIVVSGGGEKVETTFIVN